jgi:hypothetical protein
VRARPCVVVIAVVAASAVTERSAFAAPTSKLVYSRTSDAASCPDEGALRRAVAARVGYDPFFPYAPRTIVASLSRREHAFVATVDLVDENGVSQGARELRAQGECGELLDAVALAIAIAIDPELLSQPAPPAPPPPSPEAPAPTAPAPPPPPAQVQPPPQVASVPEIAPQPIALEASAGLLASVNMAPGLAAGLALGAGGRWRAVSLAVEGAIDAPAGRSSGGGNVSSWLTYAAVVPCAHLGPVFACAVGQAGFMRASGSGIPRTRGDSLAWLAAGGRVGGEVAMSDTVGLRLRADVVADLDPMTLQLQGASAWIAPHVAGSLATEILVHFR